MFLDIMGIIPTAYAASSASIVENSGPIAFLNEWWAILVFLLFLFVIVVALWDVMTKGGGSDETRFNVKYIIAIVVIISIFVAISEKSNVSLHEYLIDKTMEMQSKVAKSLN